MPWFCGPRRDFTALGFGLPIYKAGVQGSRRTAPSAAITVTTAPGNRALTVQGPQLWLPPTRRAGATRQLCLHPRQGAAVEGAAPQRLGGGDQPNAILGGFQAWRHTFIQRLQAKYLSSLGLGFPI